VVRIYGGVRRGRTGAARRSVAIQMRYHGRWEWLARTWVHRNGRFYIAANIDPSLNGKRVKLRAVVAGIGHSKPLIAQI
jgi:predicted TIM-barrel fold metal-dependent hydrolase